MIDVIDRQILNILQSEARTSNAEIARQVGLAASATLERVRKLEDRGLIKGYEAKLCPECLEWSTLAFVFVRSEEKPGQMSTGDCLAQIPGVLEVHHVAGEDCYLTKVRTDSTEALGRLLREDFGSIPSVVGTRTTIVLETIKETSKLIIRDGDIDAVANSVANAAADPEPVAEPKPVDESASEPAGTGASA
ncbi:MAG: Lrp/AsnC family transcriptional regulator [Gemmatimonadota bacterium]